MKKYLIYIWILMVALTLPLVQSCSEKGLNGPEGEEIDPVEVEACEDIPFRLGFNLIGEKPAAKTKASIVGGDEDATDYVKNLYMLCFTVEGIYLGYRVATLEGAETQYTGLHQDCYGRELITGTVPARTAKIHFIANAPNRIPGLDKVGTMENVIVRGSQLVNTVDDRTVAYWGYHAEENAAALGKWLALGDTTWTTNEDWEIDPNHAYRGKVVNPALPEEHRYEYQPANIVYSKNPESIVHLIRDRARVEFGSMSDDPEYPGMPSGNSYRILQIDWICSNGLSQGFLAPFSSTTADHYAGYVNTSAYPITLDENRLSPYNLSDASRYTATDESQVMTIYRYGGKDSGGNIINSADIEASRLFLFEDDNDAANPPKIILRVKYQKHYDRTDEADQVTKYHTLMLLDRQNQPLNILRNHSFVLNVTSMPWEGLGHTTFEDAVNSTEYENNMTVNINDNVDDVTNGKFELSITNGTSYMYQSGIGTVQTIAFEFKPSEETQGTSGWAALMDTVTVNGFRINWEETPDASFAADDVHIATWDNTTGKGTISFTLGTAISSAMQSGSIEIQHIATNLSRNIHIYSISQFDCLLQETSALSLEATGASRTVGGKTCNEYKLQLRIPGDYPSGLYPIRIRMATNTLNPYRYEVDGVEQTNVGVEIANTENGTALDGETLMGMDFAGYTDSSVPSPFLWNSRKIGEPWNSWFYIDIISKPTKADGSEDNSAKIYTIYFDDTRPLRATANQASGVGLFVKIKYFGPAQSAYVIATP